MNTNGSQLDSFGRHRVSMPFTLLDSKLLGNGNTEFWEDVTGGTGAINYVSGESDVELTVTTTGDYAIRQTYNWFSYQTGKSMVILGSMYKIHAESNVQKMFGYYSSSTTVPYNTDYDGLYFESVNNTYNVVLERAGSNALKITRNIADWNIDKLDGNGPSGINISNISSFDISKNILLGIDFQWLGIGKVRFFIVHKGHTYYLHEEDHTGNFSGVYMISSNQPVRYEIRSTGGAGTLEQICNTVYIEGVNNIYGTIRSLNMATTVVNLTTQNVNYAVIGMRRSNRYSSIALRALSFLQSGNDNYLWELRRNPTVLGTFNYTNTILNSTVEYAIGNGTTNTYSGGTLIDSGYGSQSTNLGRIIEDIRGLGCSMNGTQDYYVLGVRPASNGCPINAALSWNEYR